MILDKNNNVLMCSRAFLPHTKNGLPKPNYPYLGHIGIFVFRRSYLKSEYLKENTPAQLTEDIEWLKVIEQGYKLKSFEVKSSEIGINTTEDYNYLSAKYANI